MLLGLKPHVLQFDIAADLQEPVLGLRDPEVNLGARARVFVVAVAQLRRAQVLADLEPVEQSVARLESLMDLIGIDRFMSPLSGGGGGGVGMQFEREVMNRSRLDPVDL